MHKCAKVEIQCCDIGWNFLQDYSQGAYPMWGCCTITEKSHLLVLHHNSVVCPGHRKGLHGALEHCPIISKMDKSNFEAK